MSSNCNGMARLPYVQDPTPRQGCRPAPGGGRLSGVHGLPGASAEQGAGEVANAWPGGEDPGETAAAFAEVRALGRPLLNLYRIMANQPRALRAFLGMSRYIRDENPLPVRLRELVILATAYALGVRYEQAHHLESARRAGIPEAQLAAFPAWQSSGAFSPAERAAMTYAHEMATSRRASAATFESLRAHFGPAQIVDLTLTAGWYHLVGVVLAGLEVDLEA
jgi:4-carboxymuconolactone decarboxylase